MVTVLLPVLLLAAVIAYLLLSQYGKSQLYIFNQSRDQQTTPVNILEPLRIGDANQWISIRGNNLENPMLLYLHGGPGSANLSFLRQTVPELERSYLVVSWDQPGAGKSGGIRFDHASLTVDRIVRDAHQLLLHLRKRFPGKRVCLLGFSSGSLLALKLAQRYPDHIAQVFTVGQVVNYERAEALSLEYAKTIAGKQGNPAALAQLEEIDPSYSSPGWFKQLNTQRKWLSQYGGISRTRTGTAYEADQVARANEYAYLDFFAWRRNRSRSMQALWPELMRVNLFQSIPSLPVPVTILAGRYDYETPSKLVEEYFKALQAPQGKKLVWFDNSAHAIFFDEPQKLIEELTNLHP
jgi:pimeloyl-ACP methyl ester carboxylesterase